MYTPKKIYTGQPSTTVENLYTVPTSGKAIVKNIVLTNTTSTDATIDVFFVSSGGVAGVVNNVISTYNVPANDTIVFDMAGVLEEGDSIQSSQNTSSAITIYISGVEVS